MKEQFPEFYQLSATDLDALGKDAIVAFDASFLLDLYRYSSETAKDMFSVLEGLKGQVWLPYQSAFEFHKNRLKVMGSLRSKHAELLKQLKADSERLLTSIRNACLKHPLLEADKLITPLQTALEQVEKEITTASDKHHKATLLLQDDPIWSRLAGIFEGKVGAAYEPEVLAKLEEEAKKRFASSVPPGFKDQDKEYPYGDFILWKQLLDHCRTLKRPAFFVTSDVKQDWWLEQGGKKLGPLPLLRKEFLATTGQDFHLYETTHFVQIYAPKVKVKPEKSLDEIRKVRHQRSQSAMKNSLDNPREPEVTFIRDAMEKDLMAVQRRIRQLDEHLRNITVAGQIKTMDRDLHDNESPDLGHVHRDLDHFVKLRASIQRRIDQLRLIPATDPEIRHRMDRLRERSFVDLEVEESIRKRMLEAEQSDRQLDR